VGSDAWTYPGDSSEWRDLVGFTVEATDGRIGTVDEASYEAGRSYLVVDAGPWVFGKKIVLPAGIIRDVDLEAETVFINSTKDEIKNAPEIDFDSGALPGWLEERDALPGWPEGPPPKGTGST
jgi:hypothetical protein